MKGQFFFLMAQCYLNHERTVFYIYFVAAGASSKSTDGVLMEESVVDATAEEAVSASGNRSKLLFIITDNS